MDEFEELGDEFPDIHSLFLYYNDLYFNGVLLGNTTVEWSTSRMTLCGGICRYHPLSGCQIKLSEPLLKLRPVRDMKMVLLHEMIHAHNMTLRIRDPDPGGHGPPFVELMNRINNSTVPDPQRPRGGYQITTTHSMHGEVENYRTHWWECECCKKVIKRSMNRPPQEADCIGRTGQRGDACRDPNCGYHTHLRGCGGAYIKTKEPPPKPKASKKKPTNESQQQLQRKPALPPGQQRIDGIARGGKRRAEGPPLLAVEPGPAGSSAGAGPSRSAAVGTGPGVSSVRGPAASGGAGADRPQPTARTDPFHGLLRPRSASPPPSAQQQQAAATTSCDRIPGLGASAGVRGVERGPTPTSPETGAATVDTVAAARGASVEGAFEAMDGGLDFRQSGAGRGAPAVGRGQAGPCGQACVGTGTVEHVGLDGAGVEVLSAEERRRRCAEAALSRFHQGGRPLQQQQLSASGQQQQQELEQQGRRLTAQGDWPAATASFGGDTFVAGAAAAGGAGLGPGSAPELGQKSIRGSSCGLHAPVVNDSSGNRRCNDGVKHVIYAIIDSDSDEEKELPQRHQQQQQQSREVPGASVRCERNSAGLLEALLDGAGTKSGSNAVAPGSWHAEGVQGPMGLPVFEVVDLVGDESDID